MQLLSPEALWLLALPLGIGAYFVLCKRAVHRPVLLPISRQLAGTLRPRVTKWIYRAIFASTILGLGVLAFVAARPAKKHLWAEKWAEGIDIVITLDVSESMDATDFEPNRIVVAKSVIESFIRKRSADRIALVTFGGEAVTRCPLTRDYDFLLRQLQEVKLRELKQGTAIGMALANSVGRLRYSKAKSKVIVLITDGDSNVGAINPITASTLAKEEGIRVYSIGIGKASRVLVPIYAYDVFGNRTHLITHVPSYLNPDLLREIAALTGGKAYMATDQDSLVKILSEIDTLEKSKVEVLPKSRTEELFFRFALAATILLFLVHFVYETRFWRTNAPHAASPAKS